MAEGDSCSVAEHNKQKMDEGASCSVADHKQKMAEGPSCSVAEHNKYNKRRTLFIVTIAFIVIAVLLFCYWFFWLRFEESTEDAYVDGNRIILTPQVSGIVTSINADNTDFVQKDQLVIQLDTTDARLDLEESYADLAWTVRQVVEMFENVKELEADLESTKAQLIKAEQDFDHRFNLVDSGAVAVEDYEHAEAALRSAVADYFSTEYRLMSAVAKVENTTVFTHPTVEESKERVRKNWVALQRCSIVAPATGLVAQRSAQLGEWVNLAQPLLSIIPIDQMWVTANFKEVQLSKFRIGQPVKVTSDLYGDDVVYHGTLIGLEPGTGSVFSALPPQNATGNWIKIVQRLPVRIGFRADELKKNPLMLGLSMEVTVDLHDVSGRMLPKLKPPAPIYETDVFSTQEIGVDEVIDQIIKDNVNKALFEEE